MSEVIGHIHYWLYQKIRLVLDREIMLIRAANEQFDDLGDELEATLNTLYGDPIPSNVSLEDLVDANDIHGSLQKLVTTVEAREATLVKDLVDCYFDEGKELVFDVFKNHGFQCGLHAKHKEIAQLEAEGRLLTGPLLYKTLQNYQLNGMPCDASDNVLFEDDHAYIWMGNHRQQRLVWARIGVPSQVMAKAYRHWIHQFFLALDLPLEFKVDERVEPFTYSIKLHK